MTGHSQAGKIVGVHPNQEAVMTTGELREKLARHLRSSVAQGFDSREEMARNALESLCDDDAPADAELLIEAMLSDAMAVHAREAQSWPAITDCDRLDASFEQLNTLGIMARHNWTCCGNCGRAEMPDEFQRLGGEWEGRPIIGYAFYHQQCTESAAEGGGVYLGYGSTEPADSEPEYIEQCLRVARTVCDVLAANGLKTIWNGTYARRIFVDLDWKRRVRPPRFYGDENFEPKC